MFTKEFEKYVEYLKNSVAGGANSYWRFDLYPFSSAEEIKVLAQIIKEISRLQLPGSRYSEHGQGSIGNFY